jgi:simple sugar transport system substrate-binding protein
MADGTVKVAVIRDFYLGDHARQFLDGCVTEGRSLGFVVDTFVTGGDEGRCRKLLEAIAGADYDGLILSFGGPDLAYTALKPLVERGLRAVTFDALPFKDGDPAGDIVPGLTATVQDDEKLAELSLDALTAFFENRGGQSAPRIIRVWYPGIPPQDRRKEVFDAYVRLGKIREAAVITPPSYAFARIGARDALRQALARFPPGTVEAIWAPDSEFARGCADALEALGRKDVKLVSIDISNGDLRLMQDHQDIWIGAAAVDPALAGAINMRLLAAKFAGEATPERFRFRARFVKTGDLRRSVNMANITLTVLGWGPGDEAFYYPWMTEIIETRFLPEERR